MQQIKFLLKSYCSSEEKQNSNHGIQSHHALRKKKKKKKKTISQMYSFDQVKTIDVQQDYPRCGCVLLGEGDVWHF